MKPKKRTFTRLDSPLGRDIVSGKLPLKNPSWRKKREMYTYTETEVRELCWKLINSFTNPEDLKDDYKEDFDYWFKQNKK